LHIISDLGPQVESVENDKMYNLSPERELSVIFNITDYQNWVESDWKKPHGTYESVERFTEHTKADLLELRSELKEVAKSRMAYCLEEMEPGVSAVATPIFHGKGEVWASIGLIGASQYIAANQKDLIKELTFVEAKASARISSAYLLASTGRGIN